MTSTREAIKTALATKDSSWRLLVEHAVPGSGAGSLQIKAPGSILHIAFNKRGGIQSAYLDNGRVANYITGVNKAGQIMGILFPVTSPDIRYVVATGIPGYGPDASDGGYTVATDWESLADIVRAELIELSSSSMDGAYTEAEAGDYEAAWNGFLKSEELINLAANLDNQRRYAPLYVGNLPLWHDTIKRIIEDNFPLDITSGLRLYVWEDCDFAADDDGSE